MKATRILLAVAIAFSLIACTSEKKVGSAIDLEKLAEKNQALGRVAAKKGGDANAGFVGEAEKKKADAAQQARAAAVATQNKAIAKQKQASAVAFAITASGYDPYVIRVFSGGSIAVTNHYTKPASVTADRGEFDSGPIAPGQTWTYEPTTIGKFNFHDATRPYVVGSLEVLAR